MKTKAYFRNKVEINNVEPDSLWVTLGPYLLLVDDDEYTRVDYQYCQDKFYPVDPPEELKNESPE